MIRLEDITVIQAPIERCFDLARSVEVHLAGNRHWGETAEANGAGLLNRGDCITWRARHFGIRWRLTSEITGMDRPTWFRDAQIRGPFGSMRHDHYFKPLAGGRTQMRDVFCFAAPIPVFGRLAEITFLGRNMLGLLRERNAVIKSIAESEEWRRYLS